MGRMLTNSKENGTASQSDVDQIQQSGHLPYSEAQVRFGREVLKRKSGRNTVHLTADSGNIELMLRTIHSANQLSVHGAVSCWCTDLAEKMHGETSTGRTDPFLKEMVSSQNNLIRKELVLWRETAQKQK